MRSGPVPARHALPARLRVPASVLALVGVLALVMVVLVALVAVVLRGDGRGMTGVLALPSPGQPEDVSVQDGGSADGQPPLSQVDVPLGWMASVERAARPVGAVNGGGAPTAGSGFGGSRATPTAEPSPTPSDSAHSPSPRSSDDASSGQDSSSPSPDSSPSDDPYPSPSLSGGSGYTVTPEPVAPSDGSSDQS